MGTAAAQYLTDRDIPFILHRHESIVTFEDAKAVLPFDPGCMVKGLAFEHPDGSIAVIALRAADSVDYRRVATALGVRRADLRKAPPERIEAQLDMQVGGIAPIPVPNAVVFVDRAVLELDLILCGSGRREVTLELTADAFAKLSATTVGDFRKVV
ncbi:aminoacyl-tRNA deacylase [Kribbella deserti]|uniref:Aminoacyl-tRNA deacylase n=1 Tax=Kribbella deserti TaxID=1926257 RepID=A0ABV6QPV7_9ACTN